MAEKKNKKKKKISLVLGCGGAQGIAHIGVLKILEREGMKPDFIVGSSMGSVIGAAYASGKSIEEIEKFILAFNDSAKVRKLFDFTLGKGSLIKGKRLHSLLNSFLENKNFSDLDIPLKMTAVDLETGDEVILHQGDLSLCAMASSAIPGLFPPVKIGNRYLIDGGIVNPTPIDVAEDMGADIVIAVDLMMHRKYDFEKESRLPSVLLQAYEIVRSQAVIRRLEHVNKDTILVKPNMRGVMGTLKFYKIERFIKSGEDAVMEILPELKRKLNII
jgi:NTE family protein